MTRPGDRTPEVLLAQTQDASTRVDLRFDEAVGQVNKLEKTRSQAKPSTKRKQT